MWWGIQLSGNEKTKAGWWVNITSRDRDKYFLVLRSFFLLRFQSEILSANTPFEAVSSLLPPSLHSTPQVLCIALQGVTVYVFSAPESWYNLPGIHMTRYITWLAGKVSLLSISPRHPSQPWLEIWWGRWVCWQSVCCPTLVFLP